jgi:flagellar operon protein (TIGR03826 family)
VPELRNCKRCNKVFSYIAGPPLCPACQKEDEKIFEDVSLYIREHPGLPLTVVAKELDISYDKLMKYVREGRLQIRAANGQMINFCEKCGKEIEQGRFCSECEGGISKDLEASKRSLRDKLAASPETKQAQGGGYHFLADVKKK